MTSSAKAARPARAGGRAPQPAFAELLEVQLRDPAFRAAWDALEPKRRLVPALLRLRADANLTQRELAARAGWHPAFVSRLESFPGDGEKVAMPDLATLETYARACGCELGLVFARPKRRGAGFAVAATAAFGDHPGFRRALSALTRTVVKLARGGRPALEAPPER